MISMGSNKEMGWDYQTFARMYETNPENALAYKEKMLGKKKAESLENNAKIIEDEIKQITQEIEAKKEEPKVNKLEAINEMKRLLKEKGVELKGPVSYEKARALCVENGIIS